MYGWRAHYTRVLGSGPRGLLAARRNALAKRRAYRRVGWILGNFCFFFGEGLPRTRLWPNVRFYARKPLKNLGYRGSGSFCTARSVNKPSGRSHGWVLWSSVSAPPPGLRISTPGFSEHLNRFTDSLTNRRFADTIRTCIYRIGRKLVIIFHNQTITRLLKTCINLIIFIWMIFEGTNSDLNVRYSSKFSYKYNIIKQSLPLSLKT